MIKTGTDETSFCSLAARRLARSAASAASSSRTPQRLVRAASTASRDLKFYVCSLPSSSTSTPTVQPAQPYIETKRKLNPDAKPFHPALPIQSTTRKSSLQPDIETNYSKTKLNPDATPFDPSALLQSTACSSTLNPLAEIFVPKGATKTGVKRVRFSDEIDVIMINKPPMDTTLPVIQGVFARVIAPSLPPC